MKNNIVKIQEFIKFKKSESFVTSVSHRESRSKEHSQNSHNNLKELYEKNKNKQKQLTLYQREYQKLNSHVQEIIYQLKNEQDQVEKEISDIQKQKKNIIRNQGEEAKVIAQLKQQISSTIMSQQSQKKKFREKALKIQENIQNQKNQILLIQQRINKNQQWLNSIIRNQTKYVPVDISVVRTEIQNLKKSNQNIIRDYGNEIKRFKRDSQEVKRLVRENSEKLQQRLKNFAKKCEAVTEGKKQMKEILPESITQLKEPDFAEIQQQYKNELDAIGSLYPSDLRKEISELLINYQVKTSGILIKNATPTNEKSKITETEQELDRIGKQIDRLYEQIRHVDEESDILRQKIQKDEKEILNLRQSLDAKKKK